jgi:Fibronectin type III domain
MTGALVAGMLAGAVVIPGVAPEAQAALTCPSGWTQSGNQCTWEKTTVGSYTQPIPAGANLVGYSVMLVGGGGGGGGGYGASSTSALYGEGGSSAFPEYFTFYATSVEGSVGDGGNGGRNAPNGGSLCNMLTGDDKPTGGSRGTDTTGNGSIGDGAPGGSGGGYTDTSSAGGSGPGGGGAGGYGCDSGTFSGEYSASKGQPGMVRITLTMATVTANTPTITSDPATGNISVTASAPSAFPVVSSYEAQCTSSDGGDPVSATNATSPITVTGATRGKNYTCKVRAYNGAYGNLSTSPSNSVLVAGAPENTTPPTIDPVTGNTFALKTPAQVIAGTDGTWDYYGFAVVGSPQYQWQYASDPSSVSWTNAPGDSTSLNYTISSPTLAGKYLRLGERVESTFSVSEWAYSTPVLSEQITDAPVFTAEDPPTIADVGNYPGYTFVASGNRMTYTVASGAIPSGMSFTSTSAGGVLSGAPNTAGSYSFTVKAENDSCTPETVDNPCAETSTITITVSDGAPAEIVIQQQPTADMPSRDDLPTQPIVQVRDTNGFLIRASQTVTATASGTASVIGGNTTATTGTTGAATFSGLTLGGLVGQNYTLTFSVGAVASVPSDTLQVLPGAATNLQIATQPVAAAAAGAVMTTQPVVEIRDADTNLVTGDNSTVVTLTPENGGFVGPTQSSTATATASGGVATFSGVRFGGPVGTGKTLTFSSGSLTPAVSNAVMSTATGEAYKLVLTTDATTPSASGAAFATSPVVTRQDMAGNTVSAAPQATVTASMSGSGPYEALVGQTSWTTASGVATFAGLGISGTAGANYTLTFSSPGLESATQTVVPSVGAASGLSLTATGAVQPSGARYGVDLTQQPKVQIIDSGNNAVAVTSVTVTASVASGDGTITNNTATTDANGLATWTTMRLSGVAGPFTMSFSASGYGTVTSAEFQLQKALQTITFGSLSGKTVGDAPFGISATSDADLVITYSSDTPDVCGVSSMGTATGSTPKTTAGLVSILAGGTCTITASQAGDEYYDSDSESQSFAVALANQATLSVVAPATATAGQTVQLYSRGGSGSGAVTFAEASDPGGICSVTSAGVVTFSGNGNSCSFTATKAADTSFNATTSAAATITIPSGSATPSGLSIQSVAFTSESPATARVGDTYAATAATSSGEAPSLSIASGLGSVCSISGAGASETVTFLAPGTCQLQASSAASSRFAAADPDAFQTIRVIAVGAPAGLLNQSISFTQPSDIMMGAADVALTATATSGLAVIFTSTTASVCTVTSGGIAHPVSAGTCTIVAAQSGNATYEPADSVARSFLVTAGVPSAPFITSLSAGNGSVVVSFLAPGYDGGSAIVGYRLVATPTSGSAVESNGCSTTSPCVLTGLANGTSYAITMAAINSVGIGAYGSGGTVTPADAPGSPANPVAVRSGTTVTLTWSQPVLASGVTFIRYDIFQRVSGTTSWGSAIDSVAPITVTTYTVTGLDADTNYDFRILSVTLPMTEPEDDAASVVESARITTPGAPRSLATHAMNASTIMLTWAAPASDGGSPITGYSVSLSPSGSCGAVSMDSTTFSASCSASGLAEGTTFTISVRASNAMGAGSSATATFRTSGGGGGGGGGGGTDPTDPTDADDPTDPNGPGTDGDDDDPRRDGPGTNGQPLPPRFPTPDGPGRDEERKLNGSPTTKDVKDIPTAGVLTGSGPVPAAGWVPPAGVGPDNLYAVGNGVQALDPQSERVQQLQANGVNLTVIRSPGTEKFLTTWKFTVEPNSMLQVVMPVDPPTLDVPFALWIQDRLGAWTSVGTTTVVDGQVVMPVLLFEKAGVYQVVATSIDASARTRAKDVTPTWGITTIRTIVTVSAKDVLGTAMCPNMVGFGAESWTLSAGDKQMLRRLATCLGATPKVTITGYVHAVTNPKVAQQVALDRAAAVKKYLRDRGYNGRVILDQSITSSPRECRPVEGRCAIVEIKVGDSRGRPAVVTDAAPTVVPAPAQMAGDQASDGPGQMEVVLAPDSVPLMTDASGLPNVPFPVA